jgi:spermidine synthase
MVAQAGPTGPAFYRQCFSAVANTIGGAFPKTAAYEAFVPSYGSTWGFVLGSLGPDPAALSDDDVDGLIAGRLAGELRHYDGMTHGGMFAIPKYLRRAMAEERRVITKADPLFVS